MKYIYKKKIEFLGFFNMKNTSKEFNKGRPKFYIRSLNPEDNPKQSNGGDQKLVQSNDRRNKEKSKIKIF